MKKRKSRGRVRSNAEWLLRKRQGFRVRNSHGYEVPSCSHGPCLLFERKAGEKSLELFFACAVYRSVKRCSFRLNINDESIPRAIAGKTAIPNSPTISFSYGRIRRKMNLLRLNGEKAYYCSTCNDIFTIPHVHPLTGPLGVTALRKPSQLLVPRTHNDSESQYWFTPESLSVIVNAIKMSGCDGVLCIGTPTIFEYFQSRKLLRQKYKSFLLDIDTRFVTFLRSSHFAPYSMLTHYFYDPKSTDKLDAFFKSSHRLVIVCDPPFGAFIGALTNSLEKLRDRFLGFDVNQSIDRWCRNIVVLPVFIGKRFLDSNDFRMLDYRVCYKNHSKYMRPEKSIVRLFTDLPLTAFDLSELSDYRFCNKCGKFVPSAVLHCDLCNICPSEDSSSYEHCYRCQRCVKSTYKHCSTCSNCHLPQRCPRIRQSDSQSQSIFLHTK